MQTKSIALSFLFFFILSTFSFTHSQENTISLADTSWVSISNEFIKVSMDTNTGRYVIYDQINYHPVEPMAQLSFPNQYLIPTAEASTVDKELSSILGKAPNTFNITSFNIDEFSVVFGSVNGNWIGSPIVEQDSIIYGWRIGGLDIIQTLSIITNPETLFPDGVAISYDVKNNNISNTRSIGTRMILDPTVGDRQKSPFYLPDNSSITTEYKAVTGSIPNYWIATDQTGSVSPLSIKGFLTGNNTTRPNTLYLTTMDKALLDIWDYKYTRRKRIEGDDSAIILYYNNKEVLPNSTTRLASTVITIPSLMNTFSNNGLEVRTSSFTSKYTTPLSIDLWVNNTKPGNFDAIDLTLIVPQELEIYDNPTKKITNVNMLNNTIPITWSIGNTEPIGNTYEISATVKGYKNDIIISQLEIPITISLRSDYKVQNQKELIETVTVSISDIAQFPILPTIPTTNTVVLESFLDGDTLGSASDRLAELYRYLKSANLEDNKQIIKMIETEQQLLKEIQETEQTLQQINNQYQILMNVYKRLYINSSLTDREHINIQGLIDNIQELEISLVEKERIFSTLSTQ